jgi:hypothetical protein
MEIYRKGKITVDSEMIMEQLLLNSEACGVLFEKVKRLEKIVCSRKEAENPEGTGNDTGQNPYMKIVTKNKYKKMPHKR